MTRNLKSAIPWWFKIGSKIVLSRLPIGYDFWQGIGLFRHGKMDSWRYALGVFDKHVERAGFTGAMNGRLVLEIGPGDSVATAIVAFAHGAKAILVDAGHFAKKDLEGYRELCGLLSGRGLSPPDLTGARNLDDVLARCGARYLTSGLASFHDIGPASVDLIFSQAVLEHVRRHEFSATMKECRRVLKEGGACSHRVDLKDHLGGGLNNLRFSMRTWESRFLASSGFYTNRIQHAEMLRLFGEAGFNATVLEVNRWSEPPIGRSRLAPEFRGVPDEELRISGFDVLLRPA